MDLIKVISLFRVKTDLVEALSIDEMESITEKLGHLGNGGDITLPYHWYIRFIFLLSIGIVSFACRKESTGEDKILEEVSQSWGLRDGWIFWEVPEEDQLPEKCITHGDIQLSSVTPINGTYPTFDLVLRQDRTFNLNYLIPLEPPLIYCDGIEYEIEVPGRIEKLEENLQGTYEITIKQHSATSLWSGEYLSRISLEADSSGKFYEGHVSLFIGGLISIEFKNLFDPKMTLRVYLVTE